MVGRFALGLAVCLSAVLSVAACAMGEPVELDGVEIREYEGVNLASINDLPDNSIRGPQTVNADDYRLSITGLVDKPLNLTYDQVLDRPHYKKVVTLNCVEGWSATMLWEGVLLADLLDEAGVKDSAVTVVFAAEDTYTSSLPLDFVRENRILLAYRLNGVTLPPERGFPFQVVAESKWGYKWVKWVKAIELSADPDYGGYWEQRGYSQEADIPGGAAGQ